MPVPSNDFDGIAEAILEHLKHLNPQEILAIGEKMFTSDSEAKDFTLWLQNRMDQS